MCVSVLALETLGSVSISRHEQGDENVPPFLTYLQVLWTAGLSGSVLLSKVLRRFKKERNIQYSDYIFSQFLISHKEYESLSMRVCVQV